MLSVWKEAGSTQEESVKQVVVHAKDRICLTVTTKTEEALCPRNLTDLHCCPNPMEKQDHTQAEDKGIKALPEVRPPITPTELQAHPHTDPLIPTEPTGPQT